ncbi:MAG: hypothetical protein IJ730_02215 [Alphaproteobacteria bacterium]|nr:hypothetical protein [Alphaproteobacteria bacterium]
MTNTKKNIEEILERADTVKVAPNGTLEDIIRSAFFAGYMQGKIDDNDEGTCYFSDIEEPCEKVIKSIIEALLEGKLPHFESKERKTIH